MSSTPSQRFEFRCWPDATSRAPPLQEPLGRAAPERRTDLYCVPPGSTGILCKLRDGKRLQIKTLRARAGLLECWEMALDAAFPLDNATRQLGSDLLDIPLGWIAPASSAAFIERLKHSPVRMIQMRKARRQTTDDGVKLESTLARAAGASRWTIGLEGKDAAAVQERIRSLGLSSLPNQSYALWLADLARQRG